MKNYEEFDPQYNFVFNSYYETVGARVIRTDRGNLSRPSVEDIYKFRRHIDEAMTEFLQTLPSKEVEELIVLGLNHEQQHQELLLTDILHAFAQNPTGPAYDATWRAPPARAGNDSAKLPGGIYKIGHDGDGFCFDNEQPAHQVLLQDVVLGRDLVTNGEWLEFMADGGYSSPALWLSNGWDVVQAEDWAAPGYWRKSDGAWFGLTLAGLGFLAYRRNAKPTMVAA